QRKFFTMNKANLSPEKNQQLLANRVDELRSSLQSLDPYALAERTASRFTRQDEGRGTFELQTWGSPTRVSYPDFTATDLASGRALPVILQALVLYYFHTADGTPLSDQWLAFSELQDGRFYAQAFQGYTGQQIAKSFGDDLSAFEQAALRAEGTPTSIGDAGYVYQALPRVSLLAVAWQGDEDFPSNYQILFNAAANHYLPTDTCAIAGSMLTRKIIQAGESRQSSQQNG
ncbi:MAG: DUF3786 domain-containing protein, partial [Anaerolineales bacterium]